jgi:hypothetical protein
LQHERADYQMSQEKRIDFLNDAGEALPD